MKRAFTQSSYEIRLVASCLLHPSEALFSKLVFLIGLTYLFVPIDLIADSRPYIGHLDEIGFVLAGLVGARLLAPARLRDAASRPASPRGFWQDVRFALRVLRADLANFSLVQYRDVDAFLVTGKNSGTHWLKHMLSCAISAQYGVAVPRHASGPDADAIISHPRHPARHARLPRIGSTHTIPSIAFSWRWRLLDHPPVVVLVRDIRQALLSHYVKWQADYRVPLSEYAAGDASGRRFVADIWWYVHFFNRWGALAQSRPGRVLVVHYEDIQGSPGYWLRRVADHLGVQLNEAAIAVGLTHVDRAVMEAQLDPAMAETIIPAAAARADAAFSDADNRLIDAIIYRHLMHALGYNFVIFNAMTGRRAWPSQSCTTQIQ